MEITIILVIAAIVALILIFSHKLIQYMGYAKKQTVRSSDSFFGRLTPTFV